MWGQTQSAPWTLFYCFLIILTYSKPLLFFSFYFYTCLVPFRMYAGDRSCLTPLLAHSCVTSSRDDVSAVSLDDVTLWWPKRPLRHKTESERVLLSFFLWLCCLVFFPKQAVTSNLRETLKVWFYTGNNKIWSSLNAAVVQYWLKKPSTFLFKSSDHPPKSNQLFIKSMLI